MINKQVFELTEEGKTKLEVELETASEEDRRQEIEKTIEGITRQFMVVAKNNLNAIFELDNEVQKMLTN